MRRDRRLVISVLLLASVVAYVRLGPPRFWKDFTGMTEAQARERLGDPFQDSRIANDGGDGIFTLGWYQGFEIGMFLEFENGVVVSQRRVSR